MAPAEKKKSSEVRVLPYTIKYTLWNINIYSVISSSAEHTGLILKEWNAGDPSFYIIY